MRAHTHTCREVATSQTIFVGVVAFNYMPEDTEGALTIFADERVYVLDATGPWWYVRQYAIPLQ
jgi:hypothetical protein